MMRLIDADALEDVLVNHGFCYCNESDYSDGVAYGFLLARDDVKEAPTIDAKLVSYSKWDAVDEDDFHYRCFRCGFNAYGNTTEVMDGTFRYCPHCGARMEGVEE